jgi:LysM repeat protein
VVPEVAPPAPVNDVIVAHGDTVGTIAARHGVDMQQMLAANGLGPYDIIEVGQSLVLTGPPLPVAAPAPPPAPAPAPAPVSSTRAQAIVSAALAQVGEYQDCVKMVADSLATVGIYWYKWPHEYYQIGVPTSAPQPGDLIYYANGGGGMAHIAIYIGDGMAVHGGFNGNETRVFTVNVGSGPQYIRITV